MIPHLDAADLPASIIIEMDAYELTVVDVDVWLRRHGSDGATGVPDDYRPAAWLHDFCYRTGAVPRRVADRWFRMVMIDAAMSEERPWRWLAELRAWVRWQIVRLVGWKFYRRWWVWE